MRFIAPLPRWYVITLSVLFVCYTGGWLYTIHLAQVEREQGAAFIMPVGPHDSTSYANLSEALLLGRFAERDMRYEYFHTPGYPAFVAAIRALGGSYFAVTFLQVLMVFAVALMAAAIGMLFLPQTVALVASIVLLVNPVIPANVYYILTDVPFMFLMTLGFTLLAIWAPKRPMQAALTAAVVFAAAIYVRPVGFVAFPIFLAPLVALSIPNKEKIRAGLAMLLLIVVLLFPWMIRNKIDSGVLGFSSIISFNMAFSNLPHFWADTEGLPLSEGMARVATESGVPQGNDSLGYPVNWYDLASSPALDAYALRTILASPFSYAAWHLYNSLGFFINPAFNAADASVNLKLLLARGRFIELFREVAAPWWLFAERIGLLFGAAFFALGIWKLRKEPLAWAFVFIIAYFSALGGPSAQARYRLPVESQLSIFITAGILLLIERVRYGNASTQD